MRESGQTGSEKLPRSAKFLGTKLICLGWLRIHHGLKPASLETSVTAAVYGPCHGGGYNRCSFKGFTTNTIIFFRISVLLTIEVHQDIHSESLNPLLFGMIIILTLPPCSWTHLSAHRSFSLKEIPVP